MMQRSNDMRSNGVMGASRAGFTLIEMMVAIALLLVLAGMAVLVVPSATDGQATVNAASQVQQAIEVAKNRAIRDRAPRGIRLLFGGTIPPKVTASSINPAVSFSPAFTPPLVAVTNMEYLEQPDFYDLGTVANFTPAAGSAVLSLSSPVTAQVTNTTVTVGTTPTPITRVVFSTTSGANPNKKLTGGLGVSAANRLLYPVQPGDYLEFNGISYKIDQVAPAKPLSVNAKTEPFTLTLVTRFSYPTTSTMPTPVPGDAANLTVTSSNYKIIRQPRPIGDDLVDLPQNIAIDLTWRYVGVKGLNPAAGPWDLPAPTANLPLDIIFAPDGKVMSTPGNNLAVYDKLILWVRDLTVPDGESDPTLVVIYPKTGLIASYSVDLTNLTTFPYTFTITGKKY